MTSDVLEPTALMTPVQPTKRIEVVDVLRGFSVLGILLVNMLGYSGSINLPVGQMQPVHRAVTLFIKFFAQAKFYTLFSFLFGWGMAIQMERAAQRHARFAVHYVRRLFILLLFGLIHTIFIWDGDILVTYAVLGIPLLLFRKCSGRRILIAAAICLLIPVLLSTPGPAESFQEAYANLTDPYRQAMMEGYYGNVHTQGSYLELTVHRFNASRYGYTNVIYWGTHVFGMFLLGLYVGKHRILHNIPQHLSLFRWTMWSGLIVGIILNLVFVAVTDSPDIVPTRYYDLATRGARTIGGPALCLCYISAIVLLYRRQAWRNRLTHLAPVGRMALSNYLTHSVVCTLIFYGYGLGLYGSFGPAITIILTFVIYRIQISSSKWWLARYRFGPFEWLWRSLTYGRFQSLRPERELRVVEPSHTPASDHPRIPGYVIYVLRRLLFIAAVGLAIVYFCVLGLRLSFNSTSTGQPRSVSELAEPALEETLNILKDTFQGDLGHISQGITRRSWVPITELLGDAFVSSASLLGVSIALATIVGVTAGGLAAARRHSALALPTLTLTIVGISIPSFFLALLLQIADIKFYQHTGTGLFPIHGIGGYRKSLMPHIVPPALVLAARPLAHITRVTFVSISEIMSRDFVRTARAKGLGQRSVFWKHMLRNAGVSILTAVIVSLRFALGSLPVVEIFFDWPGLGVTTLAAIQQREVPATAVLALSIGVTFLVINLLADLVYRFIDPRLGVESNGDEQ
jgi:uncharacterized protein